MRTLTYNGLITEGYNGDNDDALYIDNTCITQELAEEINGKQVSARYWISKNKINSKEEAQESFFKTLIGVAESEYESAYSEVTGYLWTTENLQIGGHDLDSELRDSEGKYILLEIDIHD